MRGNPHVRNLVLRLNNVHHKLNDTYSYVAFQTQGGKRTSKLWTVLSIYMWVFQMSRRCVTKSFGRI